MPAPVHGRWRFAIGVYLLALWAPAAWAGSFANRFALASLHPFSEPKPSSRTLTAGAATLASKGIRIDRLLVDGDVMDPSEGNITRWVAVGDIGDDTWSARSIWRAVGHICRRRGGCQFGLLLGDNIYPSGIDQSESPRFQIKLNQHLEEVGIPFYAVLGNHDYGAPKEIGFLGFLGVDVRRAAAQIERGQHSELFRMPDHVWRIRRGPIEVVGIDTTPLFWEDRSSMLSLFQMDDIPQRLRRTLWSWNERPAARWRIAIGHHPFRSNGTHGDAGSFRGGLGALSRGGHLKKTLGSYVLGHFDAYLCGHDHSLQALPAERGTLLFVVGAGAYAGELSTRHAADWQAAQPGFLLMEATKERLAFRFYVIDPDGSPRLAYQKIQRTTSR